MSLVTPEFYGDNITTTVALAGYTAGSGVLDVAATTAPFSQTNQMHVVILDQVTNAVKAIGKLTAINSGTQFAFSASLDASAVSGDIVALALVTDAMNQIRAELCFVPSLGDPNAGTWSSLHSPSDVNQAGGIHYLRAGGGGVFRGRYVAAPSAPWTITGAVVGGAQGNFDGYSGFGIWVGDSTGLVSALMVAPNSKYVSVLYYGTGGGASGEPSSFPNQPLSGAFYGPTRFKIVNDGTNLTYLFSMDGVNYIQVYTSVITSFLASADRIGFGCYMDNGNYSAFVSLLNWTVS